MAEQPPGSKLTGNLFPPVLSDYYPRHAKFPMFSRTLLTLGLTLFSLQALAAPKAELWEHWTAHQAASKERIDHSAWDGLLKKYVVVGKDGGLNRFRYAAVSEADRKALQQYLKRMQKQAIGNYSRAEQRAYWINLYNAQTIAVVLDHYPVDSILDISISPGFFSKGPWGKKLLTIDGQQVSLDDIEHRILRPIWQDPLLHYTVNCASVGCPNLAPEAYTAHNYSRLAEAGARAYVNDPRGVMVARGKLQVSSIYVWFQSDFGGSDQATVAHLQQYAAPTLKAKLAGMSKISGHDYNWELNGAE